MTPRGERSGSRWEHSRGARTASLDGLSAAEALEYLPPDLVSVLAGLYGAPRSLAEATVQLLPFGSRVALEQMRPPLAVAETKVGPGGFCALTLTDFAFAVMAEASADQESDPDMLEALSARADALVAELVAAQTAREGG